jgi:hypothetical protein
LHWLKNITDYRADRGAKLCGRRTIVLIVEPNSVVVALRSNTLSRGWNNFVLIMEPNSVIVAPKNALTIFVLIMEITLWSLHHGQS